MAAALWGKVYYNNDSFAGELRQASKSQGSSSLKLVARIDVPV